MSVPRFFMLPILKYNGSGPPRYQTPSGGVPTQNDLVNQSQIELVRPQDGPAVPVHPSGTTESLRDEVLQPYSLTVPPGVIVTQS